MLKLPYKLRALLKKSATEEGEDIGAITYIVIVDLSGKKWGSKWEIIL